MINKFSYTEYISILKAYKSNIKSISNIDFENEFTFIRHDVEFSPIRAYKMSVIESDLNVDTNYYFQVISNAYNIMSVENRSLIKEIKAMGHNIGLHLYITHIKKDDWDTLEKELLFQSKILEKIIGCEIDSFSYHRPPNWVLKNRKNIICGLINLYGDKYFEFDDCPKYIKYLADSKHKWSYGHPLENLKSFKKFHLNMHPDEWTIEGLDAFKNFKSLIDENKNIFINTLDSETMIFNKYMKNFI